MIKQYNFYYGSWGASVSFSVDTDKFTAKMANETLDFYDWDYNKENDPIDEVMNKYAMKALRIATCISPWHSQVVTEFKNSEGYCSVDGSSGITLLSVEEYEFDEDELTVEIKEVRV